jgi:hypothetical protein
MPAMSVSENWTRSVQVKRCMVGGKWRSGGLEVLGRSGVGNDEFRMTNDEGMTKYKSSHVRRDNRSPQD